MKALSAWRLYRLRMDVINKRVYSKWSDHWYGPPLMLFGSFLIVLSLFGLVNFSTGLLLREAGGPCLAVSVFYSGISVIIGLVRSY